MNGTNGNGSEKLAAIDRRIAAAMQKRAAEKERLREQQKHETEKLYRLVGELCCKAAQRPGFAGPLQEVLAESDERARAFLRQKGMIG